MSEGGCAALILGLLGVMAAAIAFAVVLAGICMWLGARIAGVERASLGASILAALASSIVAWLVAIPCSIIPVVGTLIGFGLGLLFSLFIIKGIFKTTFEKALLCWVFNVVAHVAAVILAFLVVTGGLAAAGGLAARKITEEIDRGAAPRQGRTPEPRRIESTPGPQDSTTTPPKVDSRAAFRLTSASYRETDDIAEGVARELGPDFTVADWNDLAPLAPRLDRILEDWGVADGEIVLITNRGKRLQSGKRHYFLQRGKPHAGAVAFAAYGDSAWLGSWYGYSRLRILARRP